MNDRQYKIIYKIKATTSCICLINTFFRKNVHCQFTISVLNYDM